MRLTLYAFVRKVIPIGIRSYERVNESVECSEGGGGGDPPPGESPELHPLAVKPGKGGGGGNGGGLPIPWCVGGGSGKCGKLGIAVQ